MPIVQVNGQEIEFPDTMSPDEIKGVLRQKFPIEKSSAPKLEQQRILPIQSFTTGVADTASFGLDPKMRAAGAAIGQSIGEFIGTRPDTEQYFSDIYTSQRDANIALQKQAEEQNKGSYISGQITGALAPAIMSPSTGLGTWAGKGGLGSRIVKNAAISALPAGIYGANKETGGIEDKAKAALSYAVPAAALGGALPVLGSVGKSALGGTKNIIKGIGARGEDAISEALGAIKEGSRSLYSVADNAGVLAKPDAVQPLLNDLASVVKNKDIASQKLYSSTLGAIKDLGDDIAAGNTGLMTLDRHRQILGNLAKDITNPNKAQEAEAAGRAIGFIDDFIDNLTPDKLLSGDDTAVQALKAARSEWAKSKRFEKIGQIITGAANDANKLKRDLEKFRTNPKNTLGWSDAELEALKQASTQTTGEGVLKLLGKFGFDLGGGRAVGNTALPVISGLASGIGAGSTGIGALVPVVGTAARSGQKALASGKAENLLRVIEQGGKISRQMINDLPQAEKNKFLSQVMSMPVAKASSILSNSEVK